MKNIDLIAMGEAVAELEAEKLNIDATLRVRAIRRALAAAGLNDVLEVKNALINEFGTVANGKASINPESPRWNEFVEPYADLLNGAVVLPEIKPLTRAELWRRGANGARDPIDVSAATLDKLGVLFADEVVAS